MSIPFGFRFTPIHEELIIHYLLPKALGFKVPCNHHVLERPLYGENADPTRVFGDVDDSHWVVSEGNDRVIYVLTKLSKINNDKTRVSRRAGCGTWSGQTGGKRIKNGSGELIGSTKTFGFEGKSDDDGRYHWIMHEYSLAGIYSEGKCEGLKHKDYVICKIRRTSKRKGGFVREDDVVEPCFKKFKAGTISDHVNMDRSSMSLDDRFACSTGPSIQECNDRVDAEPAVMISNYREEEDCLRNLDDYFAWSTGPSIEESSDRVGGVSEGGNGQPLADTVSDSKSIYLDDWEGPDFSLDGFEFTLDGLDSFMGSLV